MSYDTKEKAGGPRQSPFHAALAQSFSRHGLSLKNFCPANDSVAQRILEEYGAMFIAEGVCLPPSCIFATEDEVLSFQRAATWSAADFDGERIELQPVALEALLRARDEALSLGANITPRGGAEAGRRSFADSLRLWASRCDPAIDYWCARGRLTSEHAGALRGLPLREQVAAVLELEAKGIFFSKDFSKSVLHSVAAPGASQHLAMLAFDAAEYCDERVRRVLARHGWFQTVQSDLPHFTFLGLSESQLGARGLRPVRKDGQTFWIPDLGEALGAE